MLPSCSQQQHQRQQQQQQQQHEQQHQHQLRLRSKQRTLLRTSNFLDLLARVRARRDLVQFQVFVRCVRHEAESGDFVAFRCRCGCRCRCFRLHRIDFRRVLLPSAAKIQFNHDRRLRGRRNSCRQLTAQTQAKNATETKTEPKPRTEVRASDNERRLLQYF